MIGEERMRKNNKIAKITQMNLRELGKMHTNDDKKKKEKKKKHNCIVCQRWDSNRIESSAPRRRTPSDRSATDAAIGLAESVCWLFVDVTMHVVLFRDMNQNDNELTHYCVIDSRTGSIECQNRFKQRRTMTHITWCNFNP